MAHVFRSDYPDVQPLDAAIHDAVLGHATERFGETVALIDGTNESSRLTYAQLDAFHRKIAAGLAASGLVKGDVLALHSPNTIAYPAVFHAATRAGATVTTVHPLATAEEFAKQLRDSAARWIVTVSPLLAVARRAAELVGGIEEVFVCDHAEGHTSLLDMLTTTAPEPMVTVDPAEDVAALPYSSGTTGAPKGVMLTHRSMATNLEQLGPFVPLGEGHRILAVLPFFHIYGLTALMNAPCGWAPRSSSSRASTSRSSWRRSRRTASTACTWLRRSCWPSRSTRWSTATTCPRWSTSSAPPPRSTRSWPLRAPAAWGCRPSARRTG